ncbi:hypothetical protein [Chenggangzhangella methanolivorans]|uniref:Uncharacterized protein n=2 Tax=Chenggangzhangella methanolivorans TaxID=1437009 RepID=A0A9E6RD71_9HYPH|nr:hypothetical protein [Chenggangzhangella methanolivorans]QZO01149.1 hypothetical protein K6K41_06245 [Chenggangzhangella methanolivorans]
MDEIESLGLGNQPAIAIEFSKRTISFYPTGVEAEESVVRLEVGEEDLESTPVLNLLERFAEKFVVTPNCQESQIRTWLDGTNYIPVKAAEKNIQELLWLFLSSRLIDNHKIEMEHTLRSGRVDIVIRKRMAAGLWKTSAAVELKVVRSFSSTGRPTPAAALVKHIARGYKQIREYRKELEATEGWLVTYDMRKIDARGNDLYSPHSAAAVADELNLHLEALYGTADDYRDSCAA